MEVKTVPVRFGRSPGSYGVKVGYDVLAGAGGWARGVVGQGTRRLAVVSNRMVFGLYGDTVAAALAGAGFEVSEFLIGDGERFKNMKTLTGILAFLASSKLGRTDGVVALGGGVVGDAAGFAAAVHLRGVALLQIPTTLLSMIDSSVGGKTGVNTPQGKNLVGAFHQPGGVLVDVATLRTLPRRELVAGFCEAVKHGALSGRALLNDTGQLLADHPLAGADRHFRETSFLRKLADLVGSQIAFKAGIVAGDELEEAGRTDSRSRKILNFGHTVGHALEKVTGYRHFKHGEAVGLGILFAAQLSTKLDLLNQDDLDFLSVVVHRVGKLPSPGRIDAEAVLRATAFDKKNIGDDLQWVLLKGIGEPVIIPAKEIPVSAIRSSLDKVLKG